MDNTVYSMKNISIMIKDENKMLLFGQFLDYFYGSKTAQEKYALIEEEPVIIPGYGMFFPMLEAAAEKLAHDYGLPVPEWTGKREYYLDRPYYAFDTENPDFREYLEGTTPDEYGKRNLIVGDTVLQRC